MVQDFDRRSNPNCPFNHAQANLTTHEQRRPLHEKFFAPGVNNRRFPSPKTKPWEKLKKSFLFAFGHSLSFPSFFLFFSRFIVALSNSKQIWPHARKNGRFPDVQNLHWSHRWRGWSHRCRRLALPIFFRNFANFLPRTKFFAPKQSLKTWLFKTPPKRKFPHRNDL